MIYYDWAVLWTRRQVKIKLSLEILHYINQMIRIIINRHIFVNFLVKNTFNHFIVLFFEVLYFKKMTKIRYFMVPVLLWYLAATRCINSRNCIYAEPLFSSAIISSAFNHENSLGTGDRLKSKVRLHCIHISLDTFYRQLNLFTISVWSHESA